MRNFKMVLSYDGSRYRGWQRLGDSDNTIQGRLEKVLSRMVGVPVEVIGSGRTDAGAHAAGQVANFHIDTALSEEEILLYLRKYLPEDIGVISVEETIPRFHSRLNATHKTYRYRIWNSSYPCVFDRKYVWVMSEDLDTEKMRLAADYLTGTHDFRSFCSNKNFKKSTVRTIHDIDISRKGHELIITFSGDGFLYNMVRIMVGTLVSVGKGELTVDAVPTIIADRQREKAGITAPPNGLCLMEVFYK